MKRRKLALETTGKNDVYSAGIVRITKEEGHYFFEIGGDMTSDVAEAVAILMRKVEWNDPIWDLDIDGIADDVTPEKSLFWLTGGYSEWRTLENYNKPWHDCYLHFQEEFGILIFNIVKRTKTLKEIRDSFCKHLSLPILYDFALKNNFIN
jgi:hypothetical protein